ncbi:PREDICTED: structure-specific endonuclease subunit slx1 [Dufourea novaeangliae]|uniref:structure-specific endonuclease subunit slx1 n=1 Tax=Dufourea novaeangliae TaxID=178035 RepID=UPI0007678124|nr:PREDICTED: structure-specific endonuclease subunit slx1 [Dufourea novaeangliae]
MVLQCEHFFGVYLLYCTNPKYKGRTYIGYTVDPCRRLKQHNGGKDAGGAWKTSNRGPWNMVLIVHGFPNSTSALRFEWAWQHPHISRRLKHVPKKKSQQKVFEYCLQILTEMLKVGPWCRLPLTIRWLDYEFFKEYSSCISAPMHMPMCCGKVISQKIKKSQNGALNGMEASSESSIICSVCGLLVQYRELVQCIKPSCLLEAHLICLADIFCKNDSIVPVEGICPACNSNILWGDLIRKKIGCYGNLQEASSSDDDYM